ncbi:hypothetical protein Vretimale_6079, partial [Volvox reticuliferus]
DVGGVGDAAAQMEALAYLTAQHAQLLAAMAPELNEHQLQPPPAPPPATLLQPAPLQGFPYHHSQHDLGSLCCNQMHISEMQSLQHQQEQYSHQQQPSVAEPPQPQPQPPSGQVEVLLPGQSFRNQPFPIAT